MNVKRNILRSVDRVLFFYQRVLSPLFPPSCRFEPTCSQYAREALCKYGLWKGFIRTVWRILRCHPFSRGGIDPV